MSRFFSTIILFVAVLALLAESVSAVEAEVAVARMELGLGGVYKTGYWIPCRVFFSRALPQNSRVTLTTLDPDGTPTCVFAAVDEKNHSESADALVRLGRDSGTITVRIESDENGQTKFLGENIFSPHSLATNDLTQREENNPRVSASNNHAAEKNNNDLSANQTFDNNDSLANKTSDNHAVENSSKTQNKFFAPPVSYERPIFVTLTSGNVGLEDAFGVMPFRENNKPIVIPLSSFEELPDNAQAYEMVSTVVLSADPKLYQGITKQSPKFLALRRWLQLGGNIIFNAGKTSEPLLADENALLAEFLPGKFERMAQLRLSSPYEVYVSKFQHETVTPITMTGSEDSPFLEMPSFTEPQGIVEAADADLPLIVRTARGLGTLVYVGGNLELAPLKNWRDRPILLAKLLGVPERVTRRERIEGDSLMQRGYHDLSGQLRSALDQFQNVKAVSFTFVVILLAVYLVVVGFGDWILVHKILKRPMLTWLTFPIWVILFCVIVAVILAQTQTKDVLVNQTELIDIDTVSGTARGTAWIGLYSPDDRKFDLKFNVDSNAVSLDKSNAANTYFGWFGLPGSALGGMSPRTVSAAQWDSSYTLASPPDTIQSLPMQVRSTRMLMANWETANYQNVPAVAKFVEQEGLPCGHLINTSPFTWEQCFIVYGRWILSLNTIKPGETAEVGTAAKRRDLRTAMSGGRNVFEDRHSANQIILGRYNTEATNIPYILRSMMFYRAAGGLDEFALHNAYQHSVDMSDLLQTKRAVLIAVISDAKTKSPKPYGSQIVTSNNQPLTTAERITCLRLVFEVE